MVEVVPVSIFLIEVTLMERIHPIFFQMERDYEHNTTRKIIASSPCYRIHVKQQSTPYLMRER
jgi:hypothetical protein